MGAERRCTADFNPRSPRGGATGLWFTACRIRQYFNPRSPRGGATSPLLLPPCICTDFNPRSPRGGATASRSVSLLISPFQSTLPTRGSDRAEFIARAVADRFQSTLPTRGSDKFFRRHIVFVPYFNPRSPRGGATNRYICELPPITISIHAPHEGERLTSKLQYAQKLHISIHAPHEGERRHRMFCNHVDYKFQSTLPTRGSDPSTII